MADCKWMLDEICVNDKCPICTDYCPVVNYPGVCRFEDRGRREPNLDGKCGSCEHSVPTLGHFGNSKCYVECKNAEHLSERRYYGRPLVAIRQRTTKGCKHYKRRADDGEINP